MPLHLLGAKLGAGLELHEDRRGRRAVAIGEQRRLRQHEVHPRAGHLAELADRARELALQGALVVEPLREVAHAEARPVEDLEAHAAAGGQALHGETQARLAHLVGGHEDLLARRRCGTASSRP